jgi:CheY-like chemotaxis protein
MAQILILEPHPEVRDLLVRIVRRMGHDPIVPEGSRDAELPVADVILLEPAEGEALTLAGAVRDRHGPSVVCVSIYPPSESALALEPVAYLQKPFSLLELERALVTAIAHVQPATAA